MYNYVCDYSTAKEIWDTWKEKYQGSEKAKKSLVKQCVLELGDIKQKNIELYYDHLNELIFKCSRYGVNISTIDYNLTFIMGLHKEWHNDSLMIKKSNMLRQLFTC